MNKKIKNIIRNLEVTLFLEKDVTLTKTIANKIEEHLIELDKYKISNSEIIIPFKDMFINLRVQHGGLLYSFLDTVVMVKENFNKYLINGVPYTDLSKHKEDENLNEIKKFFNINSFTKEDMENKDDVIYFMKKYKCKFGYNSNIGKYYAENKFLNKDAKDIFEIGNKLEIVQKQKFKTPSVINNLYVILDVIENEKEGIRYAYLGYSNNMFNNYILTCNTNHELYNYLDKNRIIKFESLSQEFIAFDIVENIEDCHKFIPNYIAWIKSNPYESDIYISNKDCLSARNKYLLQERVRERQEQLAMIKNEKYKTGINAINDDVAFVKNDISFYKSKLEYEGIVFNTNNIFNFQQYLQYVSIDEISDFNNIFEMAITSIIESKLLGGRNIPLKHKRGNTKYGCVIDKSYINKVINLNIDGKNININSDGTYYYINKIRINKYELIDCVLHSLCYQKLDEYNKFLEKVSKCSLKFHEAITKGIKKTFRRDRYSGDFTTVEFKIIRDKNLNYLINGKKKHKISDTNHLIDFGNRYTSYKDIVLVIMASCDIKISDIGTLFEESLQRYVNALKKSEELLKSTMKMFGVKEETISDKTGWTVIGKSGKKYIIYEKGNSLGVEEVSDNGKLIYRCIVDKNSANQVGKDALVSRIYALANDTLVANAVHTLKV